MIIAGLFALKSLLFGGDPGVVAIFPADFDKRLETYITDENTRDEIENILKIMTENMEKYNDKLEKQIKKLHETNSNYLSTASDTNEEIEDIFKLRAEVLKELMVTRIKMRDLVTEEQWNSLFDRTEETVK